MMRYHLFKVTIADKVGQHSVILDKQTYFRQANSSWLMYALRHQSTVGSWPLFCNENGNYSISPLVCYNSQDCDGLRDTIASV